MLITCENWEPEKNIVWEFKQLGCFIGCIENASWIHNQIKTKLELASRKSFPSNCIDVFFDHSSWCLETKKQAGWWRQKSIITGNPRYDNISFTTKEENIMIVYGSMVREHHGKILDIYVNLTNTYTDWDIYYKPHPSHLDMQMVADMKTPINIKPISNYQDFLNILSKSTHNIGILSSVMYFPLIMGKNVVALKHSSVGIDDELNFEKYKGHEFNFWKNVLPQHFSTFDEFKSFISNEYVEKQIERNKKFEENISKNLVFYDKSHTFMNTRSNNTDALTYYDDYNDNRASIRIINYLENGKIL